MNATQSMVIRTVITDQNHVLKIASPKKTCALIYDGSATPSLKVYDLTGTTNATVSAFRTVASSIYTGISLTDSATYFHVTDDCSGIRINFRLAHWNSASSAYVEDTINYPSGVTALVSTIISDDL